MKNKLRTTAKLIRNCIDAEEYQANSRKICSCLKEFLQTCDYRHIYFYYPLGSEADILPLAEEVLEQGIEIAFPKVYGEDMSFIQIRDLKNDFKEGAFHIMEPVSDRAVDWKDACVLVPGLVFDRQGNRIGYGKGYYDRYFSRHSRSVLIGITDSRLMIERLVDSREWKNRNRIAEKEGPLEIANSVPENGSIPKATEYIPAEEHDLKMDMICTEQMIVAMK